MLAVHEIRAYLATFECTPRADVAMTKWGTLTPPSRNAATLRRFFTRLGELMCFVAVVSQETPERASDV
jgi:hypothetical protein